LQPQNDPDGTQPLTRAELHRLTLFKWRYALESYGFADREVDRLLFLAWLHATSRTSW
jgi:hypothetical protein